MLARSSWFVIVRTITTKPIIPQPQNIITPVPLINISTGGSFNQPNVALSIFNAPAGSHEASKGEERDVHVANNRSLDYLKMQS